jgi:hypothetical protein
MHPRDQNDNFAAKVEILAAFVEVDAFVVKKTF